MAGTSERILLGAHPKMSEAGSNQGRRNLETVGTAEKGRLA